MDIQKLIKTHQKDHLKLHEAINPQLAKVLSTIGFDLCYTKAQDCSLFDDKGREVIDFLSGYGVFAIGRNHPRIKAAIRDFLDTDAASLVQMEAPVLSGLLAKELLKKFGHGKRERVYFTNSGTEAIESAIKFARATTKRQRLLHLDHAFHGLTNGSLSVNGNPEFKDGFGTLLPADSVALNDIDTLREKLKTKEYAAFIFEPIQGKGVYVPQSGFLKKALELCTEFGTLSIADEVQTGLGRTGKWLAIDHEGIEPDMIALSKALSGGFVPVGALIYTKDIYEAVYSRMDRCVVHSSTFGQNNLAMLCGLATLEVLESENLVDRARIQGQKLIQQITELQQSHDWIQDVRGRGLMMGVEFGKPSGIKNQLAWKLLHKLDKGLFGELIVMPLLTKHGILTQVSGHHQDIVKLIPPLTLSDQHIEHFVTSLKDVLSECSHVTGPILKMGTNLAKHALASRAS